MPFDDVAIGRYPVSGTHHDDRVHCEACCRYFTGLIAFDEERRFGHQIGQPLDAGAGAARGHTFEQFTDKEQQDHRRRFLGRADDDSSGGGNGHQGFDGERRTSHGAGQCTPPDRYQADEQRCQECEMTGIGHKPSGQIGHDQRKAAGQGKYRLACPPPRAVAEIEVTSTVLAAMIKGLIDPCPRCGTVQRDAVAQRFDGALDGAELNRVMDHVQRAGGIAGTDFGNARDPAYRSLDLARTCRAVHSSDAVFGLDRFCHLRSFHSIPRHAKPSSH